MGKSRLRRFFDPVPSLPRRAARALRTSDGLLASSMLTGAWGPISYMPNSEPQRLQKLLAAAGLGSRRAIEEWIRAGRVTVNGRVAELGQRACLTDEVRVDGSTVTLSSPEASSRRLLLYNKPVGEVTTRSDPQGRPTVFERLPPAGSGRWISIGRLDLGTSGLLLFTTDGELAHRLMHPSSEVEREYRVTVRGAPAQDVLDRLRSGVMLHDGPARFEVLTPENTGRPDASFRVVIREGRNREVRRMWEAVGCEVTRLSRLRYGSVVLPEDLAPGAWREIPGDTIDANKKP
jgi:23S rRNA pseudouridine2605 synthase